MALNAAHTAVAVLLLAAATVACAPDGRTPPHTFADDFGDTIAAGASPSRVVSLNPATTEMIFALGKGHTLVGRTRWDSYPDSAALVPDLGSGIRPNVEAVLGVRPDLVILYASLDNRAAAKQLRAAGVSTLALKVDSIAAFHRAIRVLSRVLGDSVRGAVVSDSVAASIERVRRATAGLPRPSVFWHIWDAPLITIGRGSYMHELVEIGGGRNVYSDLSEPSPTVSIEDLIRRNPEYILSGPEGAATIRSESIWSRVGAARAGRVLVVDTALVGRPSVRLGEAAESIARLLHPGLRL